MSFSSLVKNELCRINTEDTCCLFAELAAVVRISGNIMVLDPNTMNVRIVTENAAFARKVFSIIKKLYHVYPEVVIRKSKKLKKHTLYLVVIPAAMGVGQILRNMGIVWVQQEGRMEYQPCADKLISRSCCRKSYLRGAFLAGGSISDPEKTYHLELNCHNRHLAEELRSVMDKYGLKARIIRRKGNYVTYIKEGEDIVDFLNVIGAHNALLELENVRILKEMRNNVNRVVNCETANLEKTVNASFRQVDNILYIQEHMGMENLPPNLREIAEIRVQYADASLKELGDLLNPTLGKSGVNHRLHKLDLIAENLRKQKGE